MSILLLSVGGGGGNILRSVRALFDSDLAITERADAEYAERLQEAVTFRFLDTNEFSLSDVPPEERLLIGAQTTGRLGARHSPDVARQALEESRSEVEALLKQHSVIVLIGTGGKGTGAGTMFPLAQIARQHHKLVLPIFVRPSFERHEVDKRRYDHALKVVEQFDAARIKLMEILNDRGYTDDSPQPQSAVWERMNLPIARGLRGLLYVLWELSQVDPSDLSMLFAGDGRFRIAFADIDPPAGQEPGDAQIEQAVGRCWDNPYYAFSKPPGTSLICIQGDWSNVVDAKIKGRLAALALGGKGDSPYTPLHARAVYSPRPWGVTALLAEYTGAHQPLEIDWSFARRPMPAAIARGDVTGRITGDEPALSISEPVQTVAVSVESISPAAAAPASRAESQAGPPFSSLWEFAVAVNRSNPTALAMASNGTSSGVAIDGSDVKKLLGTMWFRAVITRLSQEWRTRLLEALVTSREIPNHMVKLGREHVRLSTLSHAQLHEAWTGALLPQEVRSDVELLVTVGRLWGADAVGQFHFGEAPEQQRSFSFRSLLQGLRT